MVRSKHSVSSKAQNISDVSEDNRLSVESEMVSIDDANLLTIGALASACGITVRTLRYYEEMDLIGPVKRSAGKYRLYNERSLKRVKAILSLQDLNYSLEQILAVMGSYSESIQFDKRQRVKATLDSLETQKRDISQKMATLETIKAEIQERLEILAKICDPCPVSHCQDGCEYRDVHIH